MLVFLFFVCTTTLSYAQHMVSGVVKDVTGEPIIGANVVEKGTTNGSITDIDGKFSFSISKPVVYNPQNEAFAIPKRSVPIFGPLSKTKCLIFYKIRTAFRWTSNPI